MNIFERSYQRLFQNLIIIAVILFSFVAVPLSTLVKSAAAQPVDILVPKWTRWGLGSTVSGVLIADVNDAYPGEEVIVAGIGKITALSGVNGVTIWQQNLPEVWYWTQPQMADLNLDGIMEVIVPYGDWPPGGNGLYVLYGNNGSRYWEDSKTRGILGGNSIVSSPVIGDIDGDGYPTIFVATEDITHGLDGGGRLTSLDNLGNVLHQAFIWRPCGGGLSLTDGDNDGVYELYMGDRHMYMGDGDWGKGVRSFWAENLSVRWNHPDVLCSSQAPPLADVNGDGILDVIVSNQRGGVIVLDSRTGSAIEKDVRRGDLPTHYQGSVYDIDGDGNLEILFADGDHGSTDDDCAVFDLVEWEIDGRFLDADALGPEYLCHYGPQVADVTGDGKMEIIACSYLGIHIIDPITYEVMDAVTFPGTPWHEENGVEVGEKLNYAVVQDIDDDGDVEIVVSAHSGTVRAFDTPEGAYAPAQRARSEVQFYSERRLGAAEYVPPLGQEPEPIISNLFPSCEAVDVLVPLYELRFTLTDNQGNLMTFTVETSPDIGSWSGTGVASGTDVSLPISGSLDYYTTYTWEVKVTDGTYWTNRTFTFRTEFEPVSNQPPMQANPWLTSQDGTNLTSSTFVCSNQSTSDLEGDEVTNIYKWYANDVSVANVLLPFDTRNATMAKDYSGYENDGIIKGATWTENGKVGGAYSFDGQSDYIKISDGILGDFDPSLGGEGTWSEITVEDWIYLTADDYGSRTIAKIPSYEIGFRAGYRNRLFAGVWTDESYTVRYSTSIKTNTWYHVAFTYKAGELNFYGNTENSLKLYLNGELVASTTFGTAWEDRFIKRSSGEPVYIGHGVDYFKGIIDEVRIYPKSLSAEQIRNRYLESKDSLSNSSIFIPSNYSTGLSGTTLKCEVIPNDSYQDGQPKTSNLTLVSTPPVASNLAIGPRSRNFALDPEDLVAIYDYYDVDGDPDESEIRWYRNGSLQSTLNDQLLVPASNTAVGGVWYFAVTPKDAWNAIGDLQTSYNVTILQNSPPTHYTPQLVSSLGTNRTHEDLIAHNQTTVDPDGDDVTNIYHWYINNVSTTNLLMPFDTDSPTAVIDYSGYDNHGEFYSPPATWTEDGVVGGAYHFDGNNFVVISDDPSLVGDNNWDEISVEFWIKPAAELNRIRIIAKKEASASTGSYMVGFQSSGTPNTLFWGINSTVDNEWTDVYSEDTTVLEVDTWYHIVCTYKEGPGLTIYINGIQRVNKPLTGSIGREIGDEPLFVGSSGEFDRSRWLNGTLDEVRIYPKALTPEQIFKRYMETKDGLSSSSTIVAQETTAGEEWKCEVIPNDSWQDGISKTSETLEVLSETGNSAPEIDMFTPEETTLEIDAGESLEFTHVSSDADGDPLTYLWLLDDVEKATTQNWTYSPGYDDAGIRNITLIVSDDEGLIDSQEWTVTVVDTRAHDVAIAVVTPCKTIVGQGLTMSINVTVTNKGNFTEAFNVTTYANTTAIQTLNVTNLPPGNSTTIIFTWNTTAFSKGSYTTSANATTVLGETDISDNGYIDGTVRVNIVGDLNSDRRVSITDIVIVALAFGSQPGDPQWNPNADMNNDGKITITDVIIVKIHMGEKDT